MLLFHTSGHTLLVVRITNVRLYQRGYSGRRHSSGENAKRKDYGPSLLRAGFREVPPGSTLLSGDVAVIQPYPGGNSSGHMTMYDGTQWISDFRQRSMYLGPVSRSSTDFQNIQDELMRAASVRRMLALSLLS